MSERIDYSAEALICDERADTEPTPEWAVAWYRRGQMYATLALVEQQRIANLIALAKYENADGSRSFQRLATKPVGSCSVDLADEIREVLGL